MSLPKIDRTNSICRGLVRAIIPYPGMYAYNAVNKTIMQQDGPTVLGTPEFLNTPYGTARVGTGTTTSVGDDYSLDDPLANYLTNEVSWVAVIYMKSEPTTTELVCVEGSLSAGNYMRVLPGTTSWQFLIQADYVSASVQTASGGLAEPKAGGCYIVVGSFSDVTGLMSLTVRRIDTGAVEYVEEGSKTIGASKFSNFNRCNWSNNQAGGVLLHALWNRALSKSEHDSLIGNPWQLYYDSRPIIGAHQLPTHVDYGKVKVPWTKKPPAGTEIDWSNPLTTDLALVDLVDPDLGVKDATGRFFKASDTDPIPDVVKHGNWGRGLWFDRTATDQTRRYGWEQNGELTGIPAITVLSLNRITYENPTTTYHWFAGVDRSGFLAWRLYRTGNTGNARRYIFSIEVSDTTYGNDDGAQSPLNDFVPHCVVGRYQSGAVLDLWLDGHLYSARSAGAPTGNISDEPTFKVTVNGSNDAAGNILDGPNDDEHYCLMVWTRALSDGEIASISKNPWQIFKPHEIMVPINEDLPDLVKFEIDQTEMPWKPPT